MTPSTQDARATGLVELAERVEAAPFEQLGRAMLLEIFTIAKPRSTFATGRDSDHARHAFVSLWEAGGTINAAMMLVPEGRWWSVDAGNRADVWASGHIDERWHATAAKPALALTSAALRARALAASTKDQPHDA